jgi:hypothetical protein
MPPRVISSLQTFTSKFMIPFVLILGIVFALRGAGFSPIMLPLLGILGLTVYWFLGRFKKVTIEQDGLLISNYLREVRVPWRSITQVSGSRWVNTRQVKITFDHDIGFGTSIVFMPKTRFLWPGQEHPIAQELRDLARRQGNSLE